MENKQQLIVKLAELQIDQQNAINGYSSKGVFVDLEARTQKIYGSLMRLGMSPKEIKEEVEEMIRNSW